MTTESTKETTDGERFYDALRAECIGGMERIWSVRGKAYRRSIERAAAEFAAPYLARIAELEAENKALREAATPKPYRYNPGPSFGDLCDPNFVASEDDRHNEEEL